MEATREVIVDLLPLVLAGDASPDSTNLVEEYLDHDADLARMARQWKDRIAAPAPAPVRHDAQALAYQEAKRQIARRVLTLATVIAVGLFALGTTALIGAMLFFAA